MLRLYMLAGALILTGCHILPSHHVCDVDCKHEVDDYSTSQKDGKSSKSESVDAQDVDAASAPDSQVAAAASLPPSHPGVPAIGGGAISIPLPTLQLPSFFRLPAFTQAVMPVSAPNFVAQAAAAPQQQAMLVHPMIAQPTAAAVPQTGISAAELRMLLQALQTAPAGNAGAGAASVSSSSVADEAVSLDGIRKAAQDLEKIRQKMQDVQNQMNGSQARPMPKDDARRIPPTNAPTNVVPRLPPPVTVEQAGFRRLPLTPPRELYIR